MAYSVILPPIDIDGYPLECVDTHKYLGVLVF